MMPRTAVALATLAALTNPLYAKGNVDPRLPKEVQPMHCLVGEWTTKAGHAIVEGKQVKVELTIKCAPAAGGFAVLCHGTFDGFGAPIAEVDLFGWDPESGKYHWYGVNQAGNTHDHVAEPPKGPKDPLVFVHTGLQRGKPLREVLRMQFTDPAATKLEFKNETFVDGKLAFQMSLSMTKK